MPRIAREPSVDNVLGEGQDISRPRYVAEGGSEHARMAAALSCSYAVADTCDVAVIGAGILGLATAREVVRRDPSARVVVLDKEERIAAHQTGRNSGVIHSGVYYAPGSAKARSCVAGARAMLDYCAERGIRHARIGKLIVATEPEELPRLAELRRRAEANGVAGTSELDALQMRQVEPHVKGIAALHVPGTAIVDYAEVARTIAREIEAAGVAIRLRSPVLTLRPSSSSVELGTSGGTVECGLVIACAGVGSDTLARAIGGSERMRIIPFRGAYYRLAPRRRELVRGLIYPVPDPRFPFLGVHFTPRTDGQVWLGPNAVLALGKEAYRRRDIDLREAASIAAYRGFHRLAMRHWRTGVEEVARDLSKARFLGSLRRYVPTLRSEDLLPGPSGIRAQAVGIDGTLVDDFWFESLPRVLVVRNAPSPAATASLALAREIVDRAFR